MESVAAFLAGFAFFLVGVKLFSSNLNQLTSLRFRMFITEYTPNSFMAALWGLVLSVFTAGNTFITPCIVAGLLTVKALTMRKAILIFLWSRVGSCLFIYIAGFNIQLFVLFLVGITGISWAISKPRKLKTLAAATFSLGLILFGIQEIKSSSKILVTQPWFEHLIQYTQSYPEIAFFAGVIFILFAQSLFGALVVNVGFVASGIFTMEQAALFTYGLYLGEAILKIFYLPAFKRLFKRMIALLPLFYASAFIFGILSYLIEKLFHLPLVEATYAKMGIAPRLYLAHLNFAFHLLTATLLTFNVGRIERWLKKIGALPKEAVAIHDVDIPAEILVDPAMTLALIQTEERRLIENLPLYMENVRRGVSLKTPEVQKILNSQLSKNFKMIRSVYSDLLEKSAYDEKISKLVLKGIERQNLLMSLENNLYEFCVSCDKLRFATANKPNLSKKFIDFVEALDIIILTLIDVVNTQDPFNIKTLQQITSERKDLMTEIKGQYETDLSPEQQIELLNLLNLFESSIWIVKKLTPFVIAA